MKTGLLALTLLVSIAGGAQTNVAPYTPGQNEDGVTYFLPQTALQITVETEKTTFTPGDFCRYAEKYLRLNGVASQPEERWEIKKITVTPVGQPDKDKVFTIAFKDKTIAPLIELTPDGILKAINTRSPQPAEDKAMQPVVQAPMVNPRDYLTEEILMAGSTAKMAELTAKEIYNIRESKNSLTRGQADYMPGDGAALKLMIESLNKQEQALLQLFTGVTVKQSRTFNLSLQPTGDMDKEILFRFSQKLGVVKVNDLAGEPVYVTLKGQKNIPAPTVEEKNKKKLEGVVYNVPGKASLTISQGNRNFYEGELPFAQFGNSEVLSRKLFDKKATTQVIFDPTTGGILKITAGEGE